MKSEKVTRIESVVPAAWICLFVFGCVVIGCNDDGLVDESYQGEPLATVNGSLSIEAPASGEKISIAVAWLNDGAYSEREYTPDFDGDDESEVACDGTPAPYQTETYRLPGKEAFALQSVAYEATSLTNFGLPILDLPPESARTDIASLDIGEGWMAYGLLIAFLDKNGDGIFDAATPETEGDTLLAVSYQETEGKYYQGIVQYLNGTFIDNSNGDDNYTVVPDIYRELSQGFNIQILEWNEETDEETITTSKDQTVRLFTPDPLIAYEMTDIQCSEFEITVDFNKSFSREDYNDDMSCWASQEIVDSSDPTELVEGPLLMGWEDYTSGPNNPCIVRESKGFVCFPGSSISDEWSDFCDIDGSTLVEMDGSSSTGDDSSVAGSGEG